MQTGADGRRQLVIVLDTNILISKFQLLMRLMEDYTLGAEGQISLEVVALIPYIVLKVWPHLSSLASRLQLLSIVLSGRSLIA